MKKILLIICLFVLMALPAYGGTTHINGDENIKVSSTITPTSIDAAISASHTQGTDTALGTMASDVNMNSHKLTGLSAPASAGDSIRATAKITEASMEDAADKKHTQNTDTGTNAATFTGNQFVGTNLNYNEGILSAPVIAAVDATHISVATCDVLIRSDAAFGADETLYRKTVAANNNLAVTASVVNYIYVTWNSGTPIYGATTSRETLNNSNYVPVARVIMEGAAVKYQLSYGALGKGAAVKNFDRVMRIRGSGGIEKESGFTITETATRVVNVGAGNAWFGLERITSATLGAIAQGGGGVESELWYHEATTGDFVHTTVTAYNNTQYDDVEAPYAGLVTLTNTARYAVNWIFRNIVTDEIDIVLGTGDYTLAQAEASMLPTLPAEISAFYVLCGRIIVKKSDSTATVIENIADVSLRSTSTTVHSELSNLGYADSGHTGFQPSTYYDTIWIPASALTATTTNGAAYGETELATNDLMKCYYLFDTTTEENLTVDLPMPENWDRSTIKVKFFWAPADDSGSTANTVEWEIGGVAVGNDDAMDSAITGMQVISDTILAGESADLHITGATPSITIDGTPALGDLITFKVSRNVGGTDDYGADARLFGVLIQYRATNTVSAW